jgi:hypothetical protein
MSSTRKPATTGFDAKSHGPSATPALPNSSSEHDRPDALRRLADLDAQLAQPRVGRLAIAADLRDDQARVAARVDPVESQAARMREAGQHGAVLGDVRSGHTDRLAVRGEQAAVRR